MLYHTIQKKLQQHRVFFTVNATERHLNDTKIRIHRSLKLEPYTAFLQGNHLWSMGSFSYSHSVLPITTQMGRYCSIAKGVSVLGIRHPLEWATTSSSTYDPNFSIFQSFLEDQKLDSKDFKVRQLPQQQPEQGLIIGHDVWIGANCVLKRNLNIDTGAVIAANSVVVKDVPPYAIVGGNPAKVLRYRFSTDQISKLLQSQWWQYHFVDIQNLDIENIDDFLEQIKALQSRLSIFSPKTLQFSELL